MRVWLEFHRKRLALERSIEKISRLHGEALKKLKFPTYEDKQRLHSQFRSEQQLYEDELVVLTTYYLMSIARRMFIPVPEFKTEGGAWEEASTSGRYHLNAEALSALRLAIRKEQKEKHELWLIWLAAITGLVGAITGLAAVLGH
jgi:hypothetical protein